MRRLPPKDAKTMLASPGLNTKARSSATGSPDDPLPGSTDARVDVSLRSMLSPSRGGSSPRFKKAQDVV